MGAFAPIELNVSVNLLNGVIFMSRNILLDNIGNIYVNENDSVCDVNNALMLLDEKECLVDSFLIGEYINESFDLIKRMKNSTSIKTIVKFIRRIFEILMHVFKKLLSFIRRKNSPSKTVNQILIENLSHSKRHLFTESADDKHVKAAPEKTLKLYDLHPIARDCYLKIINEKSYKLIPFGIKDKTAASNVRPAVVSSIRQLNAFIALFYDTPLFMALHHAMDEIYVRPDSHTIYFGDNFLPYCNMAYDLFVALPEDKIVERTEFSINDILVAWQNINSIQERLSSIDIDAIEDSSNGKAYITAFSNISVIMDGIVFGANEVSALIHDWYVCDKRFDSSVSDLKELSQIVQSMIDCGIPSKYVAYNAWFIMDKTLSFDDDTFSSDDYMPRWGQTRIVFFPRKYPSSVIKIAMNGFGIKSNKNEVTVYNKYIREAADRFLVPVRNHTPNYCIIVQERVLPDIPDTTDIAKFINEYEEFCDTHPNLPKISDLRKSDNYGIMKNGNIAILDYGNIQILR